MPLLDVWSEVQLIQQQSKSTELSTLRIPTFIPMNLHSNGDLCRLWRLPEVKVYRIQRLDFLIFSSLARSPMKLQQQRSSLRELLLSFSDSTRRMETLFIAGYLPPRTTSISRLTRQSSFAISVLFLFSPVENLHHPSGELLWTRPIIALSDHNENQTHCSLERATAWPAPLIAIISIIRLQTLLKRFSIPGECAISSAPISTTVSSRLLFARAQWALDRHSWCFCDVCALDVLLELFY